MLKTNIMLSKSHTVFIYMYISDNQIMVSDKGFFSKFWVDFRSLIGWPLPTKHLRQHFLLPVITVGVVNILIT